MVLHCGCSRGHGRELDVSPALWMQSWSWMVDVAVSPALWTHAEHPRKEVYSGGQECLWWGLVV